MLLAKDACSNLTASSPCRLSDGGAFTSQTALRVTPIDLKPAPKLLLTERLRLETPRADHAEAFAAGVQASMHDLAYVVWGIKPRDVEWARRFCEDDARTVAAGEDLVFHAFAQADGGWVGRIDVHTIAFEHARGEIGYVGDSRRAGQGLMREAALAVIYLVYRNAGRLMARLGEVGALVMTRLMAFVLLCLGIEILWTGWAELNQLPVR